MHGTIVVFSDVDGVLREPHAPLFADAARALAPLRFENAALVLCSRKTRAEIEAIQQTLEIRHPFLCEGGAALFVPAGYFGFEVPGSRDLAGYDVVEFGWPHADIVLTLRRTAQRLGIGICGFDDMSVEEVAREWGQPLLQARLAKLREYSERFRICEAGEAGDAARRRLFRALKAARVRCVADDRFALATAPIDIGLGVNLLRNLYDRAHGSLVSIGLADGMADEQMLHLVDRRVLVCDDDPAMRVDALAWAQCIVDVVEESRAAAHR
jgi:mannosyl-3-phosphoglycerate phosphatase